MLTGRQKVAFDFNVGVLNCPASQGVLSNQCDCSGNVSRSRGGSHQQSGNKIHPLAPNYAVAF